VDCEAEEGKVTGSGLVFGHLEVAVYVTTNQSPTELSQSVSKGQAMKAVVHPMQFRNPGGQVTAFMPCA
jgi:hypothetical protein